MLFGNLALRECTVKVKLKILMNFYATFLIREVLEANMNSNYNNFSFNIYCTL